jgi:hypothetical protein
VDANYELLKLGAFFPWAKNQWRYGEMDSTSEFNILNRSKKTPEVSSNCNGRASVDG